MPDTQRLFVGIEIGDAWTERLSSTADELRDALATSVRWVRPHLYHITVAFLGDQRDRDLEEIRHAVRETAASGRPFDLELDELRRLGGHEHGALVASVRDPSGRLQRTRAHLDTELRHGGIRFDQKPLVPHITLARPRRRQERVPFEPIDLSDSPPLTVTALTLVRSLLLPEGPKYTTLMKNRLGGH